MDILQQDMQPADEAVEASVGNETVLLQRKRGAYYGLNAMGTRVWSLLKQGQRPLEICKCLAEEFGTDQPTVEEDVRRFLTDLKAHDIVVEREVGGESCS